MNDGWLTLQGIQSGNHHLRISHDGFQDWQADVVCDGHPQQVVAELREEQRYESPAIPKPGRSASSIPMPTPDSVSKGFAKTQDSQAFADKTIQQPQWQTGQPSAGFAAIAAAKAFVNVTAGAGPDRVHRARLDRDHRCCGRRFARDSFPAGPKRSAISQIRQPQRLKHRPFRIQKP